MNVPSGVQIATWFNDHWGDRYSHAQSDEGFEIAREDREYCYVWMMAYVDKDMEGFFLLDVRTVTDAVEMETRDLLAVRTDGTCEWHNKPISFGAPTQEHRRRFVEGMEWFTDWIYGMMGDD